MLTSQQENMKRGDIASPVSSLQAFESALPKQLDKWLARK
jgi:hypothetical protein